MKRMLVLSALVSALTLAGCVSPTPSNLHRVQRATPAELAPANSSSASPAQIRRAEQTTFGAEEEILRPVNMPADVLQILRHTDRNQRALRAGESVNDILASWFVASEINLNDDSLPDIIVQPANPRLFGANLIHLWVFHKTPKGNELALSVDALRLELLTKKRNGYRNIRTTKATAIEVVSSVYEFNGDKYEKRGSVREPIKR